MPPEKHNPSRKSLDYDALAADYNRRYEANENHGIEDALQTTVRKTHARRILEAGCGTAHWLGKLQPEASHASAFSPIRIGLDLSFGMLSQAERKAGHLSLAQGTAEALPFRKNAFDLVTCVNAIHHFSDPAAFILEAKRVLLPGGTLAILGNNPHNPHTQWYVYDYFEGVYQRDLKRFPAAEALTGWLLAAGFENLQWGIAERIRIPFIGEAVFDDPFLHKNATSQLAALSENAYREGIRRMRAAIAKAEQAGEKIIFQTELDIYILTANAAA